MSKQGTSVPCCNYKPEAPISLQNYLLDHQIVTTKNQLLQGQAPHQCRQCVHDESVSGQSFRTTANKFQNTAIDTNTKIKTISVLTSNVCNLKCLSCNQHSSFIRGQEMFKLGMVDEMPEMFINSDLDAIPDIDFDKLVVLGGEPFGDRVTLALLDKLINNGRAASISLDINTNLTLLTPELLDKLTANFKHVYIKCSIDGVGSVNDYLRYPSKWQDIVSAMQLLQQQKVDHCVTTTLSNLSILRYHELVYWLLELGIESFFVSLVHDPAVMSPQNLPNQLKKNLLPRYQSLLEQAQQQQHQQLIHILESCVFICNQSTLETQFRAAIEWLQKHDQNRRNNYLSVFPELQGF